MDEICDAAILNILEDIRLGDTDSTLVPKGSLFCRCASIPGMHEIRTYKPHPLKVNPKHNTFNNSTPVPLISSTPLQ